MIYAGDALFLAAVGGVVFPSCFRVWAADGAIPAVVTAEIAAGTAAAAAAMCATVATSRGWLVLLPRVHLPWMSLLIAATTNVVAPA